VEPFHLHPVSRRLAAHDGLPVHPGGLHGHELDAVCGEPVPEREQLAGGGAELVDLLPPLLALAGDAHARRDLILVDIESGLLA